MILTDCDRNGVQDW